MEPGGASDLFDARFVAEALLPVAVGDVVGGGGLVAAKLLEDEGDGQVMGDASGLGRAQWMDFGRRAMHNVSDVILRPHGFLDC